MKDIELAKFTGTITETSKRTTQAATTATAGDAATQAANAGSDDQPQKTGNYYDEILPDFGLLARLEINTETECKPLQPLLYYCDGVTKNNKGTAKLTPLFYRGTYSQIKGQSGSRKSTLIRKVLEAFVAGSCDGMTFAAAGIGLKIAIIDTEQHKTRVQRIVRRVVGTDPDKAKRVRIVPCAGVGAENVLAIIKALAESPDRPDLIVIDVITHLCRDINSQTEAQNVVAFLNGIMQKGVAVLGVIHQNVNDINGTEGKATGAVGTKLLQLAEIELSVTTLKGLKIGGGTTKRTPAVNKDIPTKAASVVTIEKYRDEKPLINTLLLCNIPSDDGLLTRIAPCRVWQAKETKDDRYFYLLDDPFMKQAAADFEGCTGLPFDKDLVWFEPLSETATSAHYFSALNNNPNLLSK